MTEAIITVTTHFNDAQRAAPQGRRTHGGPRRAAHINEPTVPALAFGVVKKQHGTGLVFGLGGGTFDVGDGVLDLRSMAGDSRLCGDGFDRRLVGHPADKFQQESGINLRKDPHALQWAEKAETELNSVTRTPARRRAQARRGRHLRRSRSGSRSWPCRHWFLLDMGAEMSRRAGAVPPRSRSCAAVEETIAGRG
ncbi:Hsp70 family protein [Streptomyces sp. NBC_01544]|uniref:Hsp70 family protein n=1 Tax=unclassified Streptomyces TaxID=2593676 RepID=UPI002ED1B937|nr:Hsp70 family protein [Streptomyces sp. NBC_00724]